MLTYNEFLEEHDGAPDIGELLKRYELVTACIAVRRSNGLTVPYVWLCEVLGPPHLHGISGVMNASPHA